MGVEPVNASVLAWPADPAWASRWQHKLDTARTPADRAHIAWRALRAAVHKARADLEPEVEAELWGQVTAWLVGCITDPSTAPPPTALHQAARPAVGPTRHKVEESPSGRTTWINPSRFCTCDFCTSFYKDLDG